MVSKLQKIPVSPLDDHWGYPQPSTCGGSERSSSRCSHMCRRHCHKQQINVKKSGCLSCFYCIVCSYRCFYCIVFLLFQQMDCKNQFKSVVKDPTSSGQQRFYDQSIVLWPIHKQNTVFFGTSVEPQH